MIGSYGLLVDLKRDTDIRVGDLGAIHFQEGNYLYIGSAMNGIESRVKRHLGERKKIHWHIDYLLEEAKISNVYYIESTNRLECSLAMSFEERFVTVPKFGSSDCNCKSHLFVGDQDDLVNCILKNGLKEHPLFGLKK